MLPEKLKKFECVSFSVGRLEVNIYLLWVLQALYGLMLGNVQKYAALLISAAIHELSHIAICFLLTGRGASSLSLLPWGIYAKLDITFVEYKKSLLILLSGPLANIILFLIARAFSKELPQCQMWADVNLALAAFNMIPILPLDGGNLLKTAVTNFGVCRQTLTYCIGLFFSAALILGGILSLFCGQFNPVLLAAGIMLIQNTFFTEGDSLLMNIAGILKKKKKLRKRKAMECRVIAVRDSIRIRDAVRMIGGDDFYIFCLLDEQLRSQAIVTETDMIDAALSARGIKTAAEVFRN